MSDHTEVPRRRRGIALTVGVIAVLLVAAGGYWAGTAVVDPTASEEYKALQVSHDRQEDRAQTLGEEKAAIEGELQEIKDGLADRESELSEAQRAVEERESAVDEAKAALKEQEAAVKEREEAVSTAEEEQAANTISNGTWTVGVDIAPGTYRSNEPVGSTCYWGIYRTGTNGGDIIENDIPGGGRPTVTLSQGQDFNSTRCGSWTKQ